VRPTTYAYGPGPEQAGDLWLPSGATPAEPVPVAVLWHGGGYVDEADRRIMEGLAADLTGRGWAAWNLEYRRLQTGGGWPATWDDAAAGIDRLAGLARDGAPLDLARVVAVGFSAGAPLALWAAARGDGAVRPAHVVNQAGLADLDDIARASGISGHVQRLLGDPDACAAIYARVNPTALLPLGVPSLHVHGDEDENVPVAVSRNFAGRARSAGDDATLVVVPGASHFTHLDPASDAWAAVVDWIGPAAALPSRAA
jgi:acetyl esterase/lipase